MLIVMGPVLEVPVRTCSAPRSSRASCLAVLYMLYALGRCWINPKPRADPAGDEQPETSPFYLLEVSLVDVRMVVLIWLWLPAAHGDLAFFPLGGLILPIAWSGVMYFVYTGRASGRAVSTSRTFGTSSSWALCRQPY